MVYFIQNNLQKIAYVGESTNALSRIKNHLSKSGKISSKSNFYYWVRQIQ
ncbi:MAG: GIY-YIG nuclease family protein [Saprospiraceae bacterium]|nr:GIY-YIG nuclease family protein [Saprospiraceae bacterium]